MNNLMGIIAVFIAAMLVTSTGIIAWVVARTGWELVHVCLSGDAFGFNPTLPLKRLVVGIVGISVVGGIAFPAVASTLGPHGGYELQAVRWSGCTIPYVINLSRAPRDAVKRTKEAADRTAAAAGMNLVYAGVTDTTITDYLQLLQPGHADLHRPVLITFLPVKPFKSLIHNQDFAAAALSIPEPGTTKTVTGAIVVEARTRFALMGPQRLTPILQHEWGHIVGLHHAASSPFELMGTPLHLVSDWAPGDRAGLALLGREAGCRK